MDNQNRKGNGGLYFIVGALVLAVAIMGYFYMDGNDNNMGNLEPAAGVERPVNNPYTAGGADNTALDNQSGEGTMNDTTRQYNNDLD
jgi:hypothetical protein